MMTAIREKHKDNKELMNKEVMALYKTYGVNPASGCVPILIQLPVFFGLNGVLYSMPLSDILKFIIALVLIVRTNKELKEEKGI